MLGRVDMNFWPITPQTQNNMVLGARVPKQNIAVDCLVLANMYCVLYSKHSSVRNVHALLN